MCILNAFLDLETFPQRSQAWETPIIWFASMCLGIAFDGPCFPQMLQVAKLPCPLLLLMSLLVIMDLICSSKSCNSTFILLFVRATVVLKCPFEGAFSKLAFDAGCKSSRVLAHSLSSEKNFPFEKSCSF